MIGQPIPFWDRLTDKAGMITQLWTQWFEEDLLPQVQAAPTQIGSYTNGDAPLDDALGLTTVATVPTTGQYLVLVATQIIAAAGVASTLALTVTWTSNGVTQTETFATINNGTDTDHQSSAITILADGNSPVSVNTTYTSNPANDMTYNLAASVNMVGST